MDMKYFKLNFGILSGYPITRGKAVYLESDIDFNGSRFSVRLNPEYLPNQELDREKLYVFRGMLTCRPLTRRVRKSGELRLFVSYSRKFAREYLDGNLDHKEFLDKLQSVKQKYLNKYPARPENPVFHPVELICRDYSLSPLNFIQLAGYITDRYFTRNRDFGEVAVKVYREPEFQEKPSEAWDLFILAIPGDKFEKFSKECNPGTKISLTGSLFSKLEIREKVESSTFSSFMSHFGKLLKEPVPGYSKSLLEVEPKFIKKAISKTRIMLDKYNIIRSRKSKNRLF